MAYETILFEKDPEDKFAILTLNRPDKLNALSKTVIHEMNDAVARAVADDEINALMLTGAGRAFTTGYDLNGADYDVDIDGWRADMTENCEQLLNIWRAPIPVVAAVNGYALAGGLELMMVCDLAIAADTAKFGEPEVRHDSGPPSLMMPWLLSNRDTRWLMFTGDLVDANEALQMRMVNKVVPAAELMETSLRLMRKLARMPTPAIAYAKESLNNQQRLAGLLDSWQYNVEMMATLHTTESGRKWMRMLGEMPLKEYLQIREAPFAGLD